MAVQEQENVDVAVTKAEIATNLTAAWDLAGKIVFPWEQERVVTKLQEARTELDAATGDDPAAARAFGRKMNSILFGAFQAGMNVTKLDEHKGKKTPHEIDGEKSNKLFGELNIAIFRAKSGAWNLQYAR
jgi:hypothetical protein